MSTFPNITPEQQQQALAMALLTGGAQMMNPVGTFGNAGAQLSRGVQQGMGTFMPMMQFYQQSNLAKEDRDYKKSRDKTMDRFRKNQESAQAIRLDMAQQQLDLSKRTADNAASTSDLQRQMLEYQLEQSRIQSELRSQFMKEYAKGPTTMAEAQSRDVPRNMPSNTKYSLPSQYMPGGDVTEENLLQKPAGGQTSGNPFSAGPMPWWQQAAMLEYLDLPGAKAYEKMGDNAMWWGRPQFVTDPINFGGRAIDRATGAPLYQWGVNR